MKILFALNQDESRKTEDAVVDAYIESTGNSIEYDKEYDLVGVKNALITKAYDIVFLNEELERDSPITTSYVDEITDKFPNLRVIILVTSEHVKDNYIKQMFNIGIYDILYVHDISFHNLVKLISTPRTKMEAKEYLELSEVEDVIVENELREIPEGELDSIISFFKRSDEDEYSKIFTHISSQYNDYQMVFLIKSMTVRLKEILSESNCELYEKYSGMLEQVEYFEEDTRTVKQFKMPQFSKKDKPEIKTVEKTVEKIIEKEVIRIQKEKEYINIIPEDYNKVVAFVGSPNAGTTTIVDLVAIEFADRDKRVAVLDFATNKAFYYMKCWGREDLSTDKKNSLKLLSRGKVDPVEVSNKYHLFTFGEDSKNNRTEDFDFYVALEAIRYSYDVILLDLDLKYHPKWLSFGVSTICLINDLNIINMVGIKEYIKKLVDIDVNSKKIHLVVNKYVKSRCKAEDIFSSITKPIPYLEYDTDDAYIGINEKILKVSYDLDFYISHIESLLYVGEKVEISNKMKEEILGICKEIYPLDINNKKEKGFFKKILSK